MRRACFALVLVACSSGAAEEVPPREPTPEELARYDRYRRPDELLAALELEEGARVADVGAGTGYLTARLAAAVGPRGRVVATDVDPAALERLVARVRDAGVSSRVIARRVHPDDPGLEPAAYDRVLLAQVDHLLAERATYLRALARALAPRGRIAVSNRIPYRQPLLDAASAAGLEVVAEHSLPGQFLILLEPREVTP